MEGPWARQYQKDEQGETVLDEEGNPVVDQIKLNRYQYNGKELTEDLGLNWNDYGARWYYPAIARWNAVDPFSDVYVRHSPYSYVLNNPIKNIDIDGRLVIFINGYNAGNVLTRANPKRYWTVTWSERGSRFWQRNFKTVSFDQRVMSHLRDNNALYYNGEGHFLSSAGTRFDSGYDKGRLEARAILESIIDQHGNLKETIKIVTHSMGAAYARGFIKALEEEARAMGITEKVITLVADFDPFQGASIPPLKGTKNQQFIHDGMLADQEIEGAEHYRDPEQTSHSIMTFIGNIDNLEEGTYRWNSENQEWECTNCKQK